MEEKEEKKELLHCDCCGCDIDTENDEYYTTADNETICEDCYYNEYFTCEYCGAIEHIDYSYTAQDTGTMYCENCKDEFYYCVECGEYYEKSENVHQLENGDYICEHCFENGDYYYCENCGELYHCDEMHEQNGYMYCDNCYEEGIIQDYHEHKGCFDFYKTQKDFSKIPLYFGFELEVENNEQSIDNNDMAEIIDGIMQGSVVFEHDGSLNSGFEIISNPMTFNYIMENKAKIKKMLQELIDNGYTSHDARTCGLHIHLSKNYFTENQVDKLQFLIEKFKKELIVFSRRTSEQIQQWAKFITDYTETGNEAINMDFIKKYKNTSERYQALNLCNSDTIEFRLIRGTLKETTFFASIELMNNMARIVKRKSLKELEKITFADLIEYGKNNKELKKYCRDKKLIAENTSEENTANNIEVAEVMALCV